MDQDIDPDIMNMVATMCGNYSRLPNKENDERSVLLHSKFRSQICFTEQGPTRKLVDKFLKSPERENKTVQVNFNQHLYLQILLVLVHPLRKLEKLVRMETLTKVKLKLYFFSRRKRNL